WAEACALRPAPPRVRRGRGSVTRIAARSRGPPRARSHLRDDRLGHLARRRCATEVRRLDRTARDYPLDRAEDAIVAVAMTEMIEHQRAGPHRTNRIGDPPAGDVRRRPVDRLAHRRPP